jgi:hypothetical protein
MENKKILILQIYVGINFGKNCLKNKRYQQRLTIHDSARSHFDNVPSLKKAKQRIQFAEQQPLIPDIKENHGYSDEKILTDMWG